jgi:hypothetical protein
MTPAEHQLRAAQLAAAMLQAGARLPRDWPKELRPANPAADNNHNMGEQSDD